MRWERDNSKSYGESSYSNSKHDFFGKSQSIPETRRRFQKGIDRSTVGYFVLTSSPAVMLGLRRLALSAAPIVHSRCSRISRWTFGTIPHEMCTPTMLNRRLPWSMNQVVRPPHSEARMCKMTRTSILKTDQRYPFWLVPALRQRNIDYYPKGQTIRSTQFLVA